MTNPLNAKSAAHHLPPDAEHTTTGNGKVTQPQLLFLAGSTRQSSVNKMLAANAFEIAKQMNARVKLIDLKDYPLPIYDGDLELSQGMPQQAVMLKQIFSQHDGVFIASPEYNSSLSPLLKNTLDWISRSSQANEPPNLVYQNKVVALGCATPGILGGFKGLSSLQMLLGNIGVMVLPKQISIAGAYDKFNQDGLLIDAKNYQELTNLVIDFIRITTAIKTSLG